jgi:hypothetical protein
MITAPFILYILHFAVAVAVAVYWLRHYATCHKIAGSRSDEDNYFFPIYLILPAALGPGVYSASNRNESQKYKNNVSGQ